MNSLFKNQSQMNTVLLLRSAAIVIQLVLILGVAQGLNYPLVLPPLLIVVLAETIFTLVSYFYYRGRFSHNKTALFIQVIADVLFLSLLLYFSGGATNAFVSLLLIPIAIAAVILTWWMLLVTSILAISAYSLMLWLMPLHMIHGNMQGHFIGMWINFLFSTMVVALVVTRLARSINEKELAIAQYREVQLKQEKIIALGIASAQVTHQLATPLATAQLLVDELSDELSDELPEHQVVSELQQQLSRCGDSLHEFRNHTFDIKNQLIKPKKITTLIKQINEYLALNYPDMISHFTDEGHNGEQIMADGAVLPALFNLINNGVRASKANNSDQLYITSTITSENKQQYWQLTIRDLGTGFNDQQLRQLGKELINSEQGLGMAVFLSNESIERVGGKLILANDEQIGAKVTVMFPLLIDETQ